MQNGVPFPGAGGPAQANMPSPQQMQAMQQQFIAEAQRQGLTPQEFADKIRQAQMAMRQQAAAQQGQAGEGGEGGEGAAGGQGQGQGPTPEQVEAMRQQMQQMQQQQQQQGPQPIQPGPPKPEAIEVAKFLKGQQLKSRPAILQEKRKEMFKVKRAIRALQSPAYEKARSKNPLLPLVTDRATAENVFKLLPLSMLAIRVTRLDPSNNPAHGEPGHQHGGGGAGVKTKKGAPWNVRIEQQQDASDEMHYVWFYEGSQLKQRLMAIGVLALVITVVLFPLWPLFLRRGVWYLSMGALGLLIAFFGLAIVRLIWFIISLVVLPPGVWLYPNLFEDVGFFDSFRPVWAWRETKESLAVKKAEKKQKRADKKAKKANAGASSTAPAPAATAAAAAQPTPVQEAGATTASGADAGAVQNEGGALERRSLKASVEEADDE